MKTWHVTDVMTTDVVVARPGATYREMIDLLAARRVNALPVVDEDRRIVGVVSESDLLAKVEHAGTDRPHWFGRGRVQRRKAAGRTAADLMTSPAIVVAAGTGIAAAARRMHEAGVKQLPVVDGEGRLAGIVTRGDLLKQHRRTDEEIGRDARAAVHEVIRWENASTVGIEVDHGIVTLTGDVERWSTATLARHAVAAVPGVVEVTGEISYDLDDHRSVGPVSAFYNV
jgi:CBS-domain-containing membrane protein